MRTVLGRAWPAAVKRGERPAMLATCDDSLEGIRDRALLCFGFASGGRRRCEIAAADLRDFRRTGPASFVYRLTARPSKPGRQRARRRTSPFSIARPRRWRHGKLRAGSAKAPSSVACGSDVSALPSAGLEGDFGGHSLRSGFVTEASRQGGGTAGDHTDDRASGGGECHRVLPGRQCNQQSSCPPFGR